MNLIVSENTYMKTAFQRISVILLTAIVIITSLPAAAVKTNAVSFSGGSGTVSDPYLISNATDFTNINYALGKSFRQTCDISLARLSVTPISEFTGTYDGQGYKISGYTLTSTAQRVGLFAYNKGTIKNIVLENVTIKANVASNRNLFCGGIVAYNYASGIIENCSVSGSIYGTIPTGNLEEYVGGIAGLNLGTVKDCQNHASVTADATAGSDIYAGGIVGNNNTTVKNCYNDGKIQAVNGRNCLAAGIAAINFGTVSGMKNEGEIYSYSTIAEDGYYSDAYSGGIVGYNKGTVSYGENSGYIKAESIADNAEAGGITAYTGGAYGDAGGYTVEYSKNTGEVTSHSTAGESRVGGITGTCYYNSYVRYCCNEGNVSATENAKYNLGIAGGVAGTVMYGTMMQSCNHGNVTISCTKYDAIACGVADSTEAVIVDCYNSGDIYINSKAVNSYTYGKGAALFRDSDTTCINCYNVGSITAKYSPNECNGLYGLNGGTDRNTVMNCFTTASVNTPSSYVITDSEAKTKKTFTDYDFDKIWAIDPEINEGYPYLRNIPKEGDSGWYVAKENVIHATGIEISEDNVTMELGEIVKLTAAVLPENVTDKTVVWTKSVSSSITINSEGLITAVSPGTATVYATTADGNYTASCKITVPNKTPTFSGGSGSSSAPYLIATPEDLANIVYKPASYYRQIANISMEGVDFIPIGNSKHPFSGNYDGYGFTISDLDLSSDGNRMYLGMFGYVSGTVANVNLKNVTIDSFYSYDSVYAGALAAYNSGTIKNCHVIASVSATSEGEGHNAYVGGLAGYSSTAIMDCSFSGTVSSSVSDMDCNSYSGGIAGYSAGADNCQNYGEICTVATYSSDAFAGGIFGYGCGIITECYNAGSISAENSRSSFAGGITGHNTKAVTSCKNTGAIFASTSFTDSNDSVHALAGGITGTNYSTVSYGYNSGNVHADSTSSHAYAGGIAGYNNANSIIEKSKNTGYIKAGSTGGESRAGGISSSTYTGSIVRYCCNSGKVEIYDNPYYWLGLAGGVTAVLQYGTVTECCNHGEVVIDSSAYYPIGAGITNFTEATLTNCYSDGSVHSKFKLRESYNPGMICGIGEGCDTPLKNCYFAGLLTSLYTASKYGLIWTNGQGGNTMEGCYTLNLYSSTESSSLISESASKLQSTYAGYDFTSIWGIDPEINDGRPYLLNVPADDDAGWYSGIEEQPSLEGHVESDWIVEIEPTCLVKGYKYTECTICKKVLKTESTYSGHKLGDWYVNIESTCTSEGKETRECEVCGTTETQITPALGHEFCDWYTVVEPSCSGNGWEQRDCGRCEICEVNTLIGGHQYDMVVTEPTCTDEGYTVYTCKVCGKVTVDDYMEALGHDFSDWYITREPTCEEKGFRQRDCYRCYESEIEEIEATSQGHDVVVTEPTCTEKGYTTYTCKVCGKVTVGDYVDALGHDFSEWYISREPTCEKKGFRQRDCYRCYESEIEELTATGHSYNKVVTEPTCTEKGYTTHTCHCGDSYIDDYTDAPGHDLIVHEAKAPTCTEIGWNEYETCSRCDYTTYSEIAATGHSYNKVVTAPTCTEIGFTTYTCHCGDSYISDYVDALGHDFGEWYTTLEPTCLDKGTECRDCLRCDHFETQEIASLGHDLIVHEAKAPTCTEIGWNEYETCSRCDYTTYSEIAATGHSYNKVVTAPTCTEIGFTTYTCHCGDSYIDNYVDALGHSFGEWYTTLEPTCLDKGTECRDCSRCDHFETQEIAALGHDLIVHEAKAPTCTEIGWNEYETCSRCDYTTYKELSALGHDLTVYRAKTPTCTEIGWYAYKVCSRCNYSTYNELPALGHDFGEWYETKTPTCLDNGTEQRDCARCDHSEIRETASLGHSYDYAVTKPTCTEKGFTTYVCHCGDIYVSDYVDALGHDYGGWYETKAPNCTENGTEQHDCARCGHFEVTDVSPLGHDLKVFRGKAPTCTEVGWYGYKSCARCDYSTYEEIPATGHSFHMGFCTSCNAPDPDFMKGDLDGDGKVNAKDANILIRIVAGSLKPTELQEQTGDLNGDGLNNAIDANLITRIISGQ